MQKPQKSEFLCAAKICFAGNLHTGARTVNGILTLKINFSNIAEPILMKIEIIIKEGLGLLCTNFQVNSSKDKATTRD